MSHRINIIGASGSGASTLGRALSDALAVPCFDADDFYHEPSDPPFQKQRSPADCSALIRATLSADSSWVLAGGIDGWASDADLGFTLIVFLSVPTEDRMDRLRRRESERFGDRVLPGGDMHASHQEFLDWASRYEIGDVEGKTRARHEAYLARQSCPVLRLDGLLPIARLVELVEARCGETPR